MSFQIRSHKSKMTLHLKARSRTELFLTAAKGNRFLILQDQEFQSTEDHISLIHGKNDQEMLGRWLRELAALFEYEKKIPTNFTILSIHKNKLKCLVGLTPYNPKLHKIHYDIGEDTYQELKLKKSGASYHATVYSSFLFPKK